MIDYLNNQLPFQPDFILHTGDVTNFPDADSAKLAAQVMNRLKYPVYYVCGNHDGRAALRKYLMNQSSNETPITYDFIRDDTHFIVLDTRGDIDPQGLVSAEQLAWLGETCQTSPAQSLCLWIHHLPVRMYVPWYDRDMRIMNDEAFFEVLKPHRDRLRGIFFGHIHRAFTGYRDGILCSAAASTFMQLHTNPHDEHLEADSIALPGYAIVTMTHQQTTVTHHTIPRVEEKD
jgi:3',5'-cyclic AMP phosphodiesterase CpdA